jgi:hypothetical protein
LRIKKCPELSRRCRNEDGPKIAHVPDVELDEDDDISVILSEEDDEVRANLSSCSSCT